MSHLSKIFYTRLFNLTSEYPAAGFSLFYSFLIIGEDMDNSIHGNAAKHFLIAELMRLFYLMYLVGRI